MSTIGGRLEHALKQAGMTQKALARAVHIDESTIRKWKSGTRPRSDMIEKVAEVLGVSTSWLLEGPKPGENHDAPRPVETVSLPLYGDIPAGVPVDVAQAAATHPVLRHLARPNRYVLRVKGDSMEDEICPGDLVLMEAAMERGIEKYANRICAVTLDGQSTLKRVQVQRTNGDHIIILKAHNPHYTDEVFVLGTRRFEIQAVALKIVERELH